jgi:hypothetical protein
MGQLTKKLNPFLAKWQKNLQNAFSKVFLDTFFQSKNVLLMTVFKQISTL